MMIFIIHCQIRMLYGVINIVKKHAIVEFTHEVTHLEVLSVQLDLQTKKC